MTDYRFGIVKEHIVINCVILCLVRCGFAICVHLVVRRVRVHVTVLL